MEEFSHKNSNNECEILLYQKVLINIEVYYKTLKKITMDKIFIKGSFN